ncbi:Trp biosynthesis-associated membrane protein [Actinoplanes utahensis]|uniref:Trp biosynthesis associated, transmembrane protein, oprn/chp n=1 Tax=Actinoplanes utahensis TaxID=1869 RepID=A0A0A6URK3_ACTUT|nr:Trp biosynthesis-associated membrane protein [Actinoplanes utahensis]KHD77648.1 trp biosynthesis associated, transmembrane protein, oprn/chp [Actinoplanes utahensis]GIF34656.1 membrane protein [Actinoplanes utahensis]
MTRHRLAAVLACLAGAALTLYAATRVWAVQVEQRPGLSDLRTEQTGSDVQPWLTGLALVALAGAGALFATRGVVRRVLGVLLALSGAGIAVGAVLARAGADPGAVGAAGTLWPVACVIGGAVVAVGGVVTARHGHRWAAMSSRYERRPAGPVEKEETPGGRALWDALDRGEDPTAG